VIHGANDTLVPLAHAKLLLAAAKSHIKQFHFEAEMVVLYFLTLVAQPI
jgi:fermentation-respiration switch protein FrsA (DUF1100 family)